MDFVALVRYPGVTAEISKAIEEMEQDIPAEIVQFEAFLKDIKGYFGAAKLSTRWSRVGNSDNFGQPIGRPALPDPKVSLSLANRVHLSFGHDALHIVLVLRWLEFLRDLAIREAVLAMLPPLIKRFQGTECVLTTDYSPISAAFDAGATFDAAVTSAGAEHPEVDRVEELYIAIGDQGTWDTRGYWRMPV